MEIPVVLVEAVVEAVDLEQAVQVQQVKDLQEVRLLIREQLVV